MVVNVNKKKSSKICAHLCYVIGGAPATALPTLLIPWAQIFELFSRQKFVDYVTQRLYHTLSGIASTNFNMGVVELRGRVSAVRNHPDQKHSAQGMRSPGPANELYTISAPLSSVRESSSLFPDRGRK